MQIVFCFLSGLNDRITRLCYVLSYWPCVIINCGFVHFVDFEDLFDDDDIQWGVSSSAFGQASPRVGVVGLFKGHFQVVPENLWELLEFRRWLAKKEKKVLTIWRRPVKLWMWPAFVLNFS